MPGLSAERWLRWARAILCAAQESGQNGNRTADCSRGAFVPSGGAQQRDNERELRLKAQIGNELPVEAELERWFPLWGIPI